MTRFSLRWILLWPILFTVSIGLVALAVYVDRTARTDQIAAVDDELARVEQRVAIGGPPDRPGATITGDVNATEADAPVQLVIGPDGALLETLSGLNPFSVEQITVLSASDGTTTLGTDPRYRALITPQPSGVLFVSALALDQVDASISSLRSSLLVGGIVIFLFVGGIVMLIATTVTRPVTRMSLTANKIAAGALDTPIDPPTGSRETADLAVDLEQMVSRLTSSLADAHRARDDMQRFLADASHELRTPLTSLRGYSDLYARNMLDEPGHLDRAMDRIGSESTRLTRMVNDMLQLARGDGAPDSEFEPVGLADIARDVVDDLTAGFPDHHIEMHHDVESPTSVRGDRAQLHQCLVNLVANACHHGGDDVDVIIGTRTEADEATVAVIDHGVGIEPDLTETVFLPFYRGDASRTRDGHGGAGLGLALARQIAERHDGRIEVGATEGGGATFVVILPVILPVIGDQLSASRVPPTSPTR